MDAARDGVWDWNVPTDVSVCNDAYFSMLGYTRQELGAAFQHHFVELLHPDERDALLARIQESLVTAGHYSLELRMRGKNGQYRWIASRGKVVERDTAETALRVIGTHRDITERKVAELALLELNATLEQKVAERTAQLAQAKAAAEMAARTKSEFLANMSHEIRTPMNAILGLTQLLQRDTLTPDQQDLLHKISAAGAGLLHIINDILDFSKIEARQMSLDYQPFALDGLLQQVENLLAGSAADKGLTLEFQRPEGPTEQLLGDGLRIQQILVNLASNALKFTERGRIELRVIPRQETAMAQRLRFEVSDTGIGISPAALAQLFQPFTQADASTTRRFGGTGLGLSISKRLVEMMGGTIGASSTPGAGSTFWFELPLARVATDAPTHTPPITAPAPAAPRGPRLSGLRVLGVDDNRLNLFLLERALQLEGASVHLAADGQQALQTLRAHPGGFDVVLMDIQMPVMDGLTATREIRQDPALRDLPVIALTAGVLGEEREAARNAGMDDFLAKPLDLTAMVAMLRPYALAGDAEPRPAPPAIIAPEA